jgi:hypothetical protein
MDRGLRVWWQSLDHHDSSHETWPLLFKGQSLVNLGRPSDDSIPYDLVACAKAKLFPVSIKVARLLMFIYTH